MKAGRKAREPSAGQSPPPPLGYGERLLATCPRSNRPEHVRYRSNGEPVFGVEGPNKADLRDKVVTYCGFHGPFSRPPASQFRVKELLQIGGCDLHETPP
jgi:hypothetical protein